eukprot:12378192-Alexandrium_andersonii.AAC.1
MEVLGEAKGANVQRLMVWVADKRGQRTVRRWVRRGWRQDRLPFRPPAGCAPLAWGQKAQLRSSSRPGRRTTAAARSAATPGTSTPARSRLAPG